MVRAEAGCKKGNAPMNRDDRKVAVAAYKERKSQAGIYVVRCAPSGQCWIGAAPDLSTIWNRLSFGLRQGVAAPASLQSAWATHGAESLSFEIVETVDADDLSYGRDRKLRERRDQWCEAMKAEPI
jgi:hypothetical protein